MIYPKKELSTGYLEGDYLSVYFILLKQKQNEIQILRMRLKFHCCKLPTVTGW